MSFSTVSGTDAEDGFLGLDVVHALAGCAIREDRGFVLSLLRSWHPALCLAGLEFRRLWPNG